MKLFVEEIKRLQARLAEINSVEFDDLEFFFSTGERLEISEKCRENWSYCGLSNCDFIKYEYYKDGRVENDK